MSEFQEIAQDLCNEPLDGTKQKGHPHYLAVFDFDFTVVDHNTDTTVRDLLPMNKMPKHIGDLVDTVGWTRYMACVFRQLHKHNITPTEIRYAVSNIPEVPGCIHLLKRLHHTNRIDLIVISDSNAVFVNEWLGAHGLRDYFVKIFTNPAHFEGKGLLTVRAYHQQKKCKLSARNLCKGKVLDNFLEDQCLLHNRQYERIFYVGNGKYDICPVLRLRSRDFVFARQGFAMHNIFIQKPDKRKKLHATLLTWTDGLDLLDKIEVIIGETTSKQELKTPEKEAVRANCSNEVRDKNKPENCI